MLKSAIKAPPQSLEQWSLKAFVRNEFAAIAEKVESAMSRKIDLNNKPTGEGVSAKTLLIYGVCLRRLERNQQAYDCFKALAGRMGDLETENQLDVLDGLTACAIALGDPAAASHYGKQALEARAQVFQVPPLAWADDWRTLLEQDPVPPPVLPGVNVISYSLFGHKPVYTEMLVMNLAAAAVLYPRWQVWVYVDHTVPVEARARLAAGGAVIKPVTARDQKLPATTWRFLAMEDPTVDRVLLRDADSYLTPREVGCVGEWLQAGAAVHAMRDWYTHSELLLAGLFGVRAAGFRRIRDALEHFAGKAFTPSHADQHFLRRYMWPYAQHSHTVHDSVFHPKGTRPFPSPISPTLAAHAGNRLSKFMQLDAADIAQSGSAQLDMMVGDTVMGSYPCEIVDGKSTVEIPNVIHQQLAAGVMALRVRAL